MSTVVESDILKEIEKLKRDNITLTRELAMTNTNLARLSAIIIELIEPETEEYLPTPEGPGKPELTMFN